MKRRVSTLTAVVIGMLLFSPSAQSQGEVDSALKMFLGPDSSTFAFDLDKARPKSVYSNFAVFAQNHLPTESWIKHPSEAKLRKLTCLEPILRLHQRESLYEIRLYEATQAFVASHFGAALLISTAALDLLDPTELQASAAHEIGHEYVWKELEIAVARRDARRQRELELFCDGVAILTLRQAEVDPSYLLTGVEKLTRFNTEARRHLIRFDDAGIPFARTKKPPKFYDDHPSLKERKKFAEALMRLSASIEPQLSPAAQSQIPVNSASVGFSARR